MFFGLVIFTLLDLAKMKHWFGLSQPTPFFPIFYLWSSCSSSQRSYLQVRLCVFTKCHAVWRRLHFASCRCSWLLPISDLKFVIKFMRRHIVYCVYIWSVCVCVLMPYLLKNYLNVYFWYCCWLDIIESNKIWLCSSSTRWVRDCTK